MAQMTASDQNALMRQLLTRNSPRILKKLPIVNGTVGGTTRIKLYNTGLITRLFVDIQLPYNYSAAPTANSNKSILAAIPKIQLIDFDGSTRVNTSAYHLSILNAIRGRANFAGLAYPGSLSGLTTVASGMTNDVRAPQTPLGTGAQVGRIVLEIPVAADVMKGDLRGMLAAQFVSGEIQLAIDIAAAYQSATQNDDFWLVGGTLVSLGTPTIQVYQEYYLPQKINGVTAIPQQDIATVYEIGVYSRTSANIASGVETLINFPIVREVNCVVLNYINNALLGGGSSAADLQLFTVYANGNNILYQTERYTQNYLQRSVLDLDLPQGSYALDFAAGPISTAIFGNVQLAVTAGTAPTNPAIESSFESIYAKGSAMAGAAL